MIIKTNSTLLICITGIDGSGKTTLSKELVEFLNLQGVRCKYVYARLSPLILQPFITIGNWIFLRKQNMFKNYSAYSDEKKRVLENHSFLSKIYQQILLFDYFFQTFFKVRIPLLFGTSIVCDRYVYDTVITDLSVDMKYSDDKIKNVLDNIFIFLPEPDITFLIDVSEDIAYKRKSDIPSIEYLKQRRKTYLNMGKERKMVILDGSKNLNSLRNVIKRTIINEIK